MRLLAVAGPILCDVIPKGSQGTDQDPAVYPVSPQANNLLIKISQYSPPGRIVFLL